MKLQNHQLKDIRNQVQFRFQEPRQNICTTNKGENRFKPHDDQGKKNSKYSRKHFEATLLSVDTGGSLFYPEKPMKERKSRAWIWFFIRNFEGLIFDQPAKFCF